MVYGHIQLGEVAEDMPAGIAGSLRDFLRALNCRRLGIGD
jgi:hypothetical protein